MAKTQAKNYEKYHNVSRNKPLELKCYPKWNDRVYGKANELKLSRLAVSPRASVHTCQIGSLPECIRHKLTCLSSFLRADRSPGRHRFSSCSFVLNRIELFPFEEQSSPISIYVRFDCLRSSDDVVVCCAHFSESYRGIKWWEYQLMDLVVILGPIIIDIRKWRHSTIHHMNSMHSKLIWSDTLLTLCETRHSYIPILWWISFYLFLTESFLSL